MSHVVIVDHNFIDNMSNTAYNLIIGNIADCEMKQKNKDVKRKSLVKPLFINFHNRLL